MDFATNWIIFSAFAIVICSSIETRKFAQQIETKTTDEHNFPLISEIREFLLFFSY